MSLELVLATISALIAILAEGRAIWLQRRLDARISGAIALLRIIQVLDRIILTGQDLLTCLASIPLSDDERYTRYATLREKRRIADLITQQVKNISDLATLLDQDVLFAGEASISLGETVDYMVPGSWRKELGFKGASLQVATWKLVSDVPPLSNLGFKLRTILRSFAQSVRVDARLTLLMMTIPTKVRLYEAAQVSTAAVVDEVTYDLKSPRDLRMLLSRAQADLKEIQRHREQLATYIRDTCSLADLLG